MTAATEIPMIKKLKVLVSLVVSLMIVPGILGEPGPSEAQSVRDTVKEWNKRAADMTIEEGRNLYEAKTDAEKKVADVMAEFDIAEAKLQKAVKTKWGDVAEKKIAEAFSRDALKDDDEADIVIKGDRAVMTFKNEALGRVLLVKSGGVWKVDCEAFVAEFRGLVSNAEIADTALTEIAKEMSKALASNSFPDFDALLTLLKKKVAALDEAK